MCARSASSPAIDLAATFNEMYRAFIPIHLNSPPATQQRKEAGDSGARRPRLVDWKETGVGQGEMNAALESRAPFFKVMHFEAPENTRREKERLTKARHFFSASRRTPISLARPPASDRLTPATRPSLSPTLNQIEICPPRIPAATATTST